MTARRPLLLLLAVSLALRLGGVGALVLLDAQPAFDEYHYVQRALGWASLLGLSDAYPAAEAWAAAYDGGFQPPLQPLLTGLLTGGARLPLSGRVLNALLGAAGSLLAAVFARRFVGRREALAAGWIHALWPTAIFFGASLWAEPLYVLLLLGAAGLALRARDGGGARTAAAAGAALGLLLLTRTAALPYLAVLPWLAAGGRRDRARLAGLVLAGALVVAAPWQIVLMRDAGGFPLLSTSGGWNLALGNAPDVGPGEGSLWVGPEAHDRLREEIAAAGGAGAYALHEIRRDPAAAAARALDRLRLTWAADLFPVRHAAHVIHQPLPAWAGLGRWLGVLAVWLVLLSWTGKGLLAPGAVRDRGALLLLAGAGCLGPLLTVGFPRLHHPLLVLLLPAAAAGWALRGRRLPLARQLVLAAGMGGLTWLTTSSLPAVIETQLLPSAAARAWVAPVAAAAGARPVYADQVEVRWAGGFGSLTISPSPDVRLTRDAAAPGRADVTVHAGAPGGVRGLVLRRDGGPDVVVDPARPEWWRRWRPLDDLGLQGVEIRWLGGGAPDRRAVVRAGGR